MSCFVAGANRRLSGVARTKTLTGSGVSIDQLDCEPLHSIVGLELCAQFMQMFDVHLSNGHTVRAFKHSTTRGYLHLDRTEPGLCVLVHRHRKVSPGGPDHRPHRLFRGLRALQADDEAAEPWHLLNLALDRLETSPVQR
jgi:hypothetical protein